MSEQHPIRAYRHRTTPPMSRAALAEVIGVDRSTVARWETGDRRPDDKYLLRLADLTGATIPELIGIASKSGGA